MQVGEKYLSKEDVLPMLKYYVSAGDEDSLSTWYSQVNHAFTKSRRPWFEFPGPGTVEETVGSRKSPKEEETQRAQVSHRLEHQPWEIGPKQLLVFGLRIKVPIWSQSRKGVTGDSVKLPRVPDSSTAQDGAHFWDHTHSD